MSLSSVQRFKGRNQTLINMLAEGKQREGFHSAGKEWVGVEARPAGGKASGPACGVSSPSFLLPAPPPSASCMSRGRITRG